MYSTAINSPSQGISAAKTARNEREPVKLRERIGSTTYVVSICFSETSKETLEDKLLRLIEREEATTDAK